jgi:hypothetical protein
VTYDEVSKAALVLPYRDKLRLALLMIQLASKEEELQNPQRRAAEPSQAIDDELTRYVAERLYKLRPSKRDTVLNSIAAMFQFQGGISAADKEAVLSSLQSRGYLSFNGDRAVYPAGKA